MRPSTFCNLYALAFEHKIWIKVCLQFASAMVTITTLPILIASKAYGLIDLHFYRIHNYNSVLEPACDGYYRLSFAIQSLNPLWLPDNLFCVFTWQTRGSYINTCLEIGTGPPAVSRIVLVDCEAVACTGGNHHDFTIFDTLDRGRRPSGLCITMPELPQ